MFYAEIDGRCWTSSCCDSGSKTSEYRCVYLLFGLSDKRIVTFKNFTAALGVNVSVG